MNARVRVARIVPGSDLITERQKPRISPARIRYDSPSRERVPVAYCRGAFHGLFDAMAEYNDKEHRLLMRYPVRHNDVDGRFQTLSPDAPLPKEWLNEHNEQAVILACLGDRRLTDLQNTLKW